MRRAVGAALGSLTLRGRCLAAAGVLLLLIGVLVGERALVQGGVFVLALPVVSAVVVARERFTVSSRRTVTPARVPRGQDAEVLLELSNEGWRTGGLWTLTEQLPDGFGAPPSFLVDRLQPGQSVALPYRLHGARRGRYELGPLRLRVVDPFGLVARSTAGADTVPLVVVPRVRPLGPGGTGGGVGGSGEGLHRAIAVQGEDDVTAREYRQGDDLRKVHWRATARAGELMVRLEERPWRASATLLLDTRIDAHLLGRRRGGAAVPAPLVAGPAGDPDPPPDSLEWLVEAAATVGSALARSGAAVRLVTEVGAPLARAAATTGAGAEELLDRLAGITASTASALGPGIVRACRAAGDGPVVCLLGAVGPEEVTELVRARTGPARDLAVLADIGSWADAATTRNRRGPGGSRATLAQQTEDAAALLRAAGWRVAVARADRTVEQVWAELTGPLPGAAPAVAMPAARPAPGVPA